MSEHMPGKKVDKVADDEKSSPIIAVFPTTDGNFRYVADMKEYASLQFFNEEKLVVVGRR